MNSEHFYKCLANETRLRCVMLLLARPQICVCDIADALELSQPMISRHLAQLRTCNLLSDQRDGQWVYYRLHHELKAWQFNVLKATQAGVATEQPFAADLLRLAEIEQQKTGSDCC